MHVWTIANQKGGVGKTTSTVTLAGLLSQLDYRVLLIDLDPHGSLTSYFSFNPDELEESVYSFFQKKISERRTPLASMLCKTGIKNLDLLPASTSLISLDRQAGMTKGLGLVVKDALQPYARHYDYVLIDCPPTMGILMVNALAVCERLIIPVQTEFLAIKGLERILHTLNMILSSGREPPVHHIVPTMFDRRTRAAIESLSYLRSNHANNLWQGYIPVDTKFREASRLGKPGSYLYPQSKGIQSYRLLLDTLLQDSKNETIEPTEEYGLIA